jgi:pimeloyl-ACP methyl ester carboxylesterase
MKTTILTIALTLMTIFNAYSQTTKTEKNTTKTEKHIIVIIPGAWSSAADWGYVVPELEAAGNEVIVVNLAGHGSDKTPITNISLKGYVDAVKEAIGKKKNITLVAHSFGGVVASQVAEEIPTQIKELLFVAAYVPKNGESLLSLATADADSHVGKSLVIKENEGIAVVSRDGIIDSFFADAPKQVQDYVIDHFPAEPLAPLATPVKTTAANLGKVKKVFVFTANDHTNSPALQHKMVEASGIKKTYTLQSSHTPFVSRPKELADIINKEAK